MNICLILSAGTSNRFGGDIPKQYKLLAGKEVVTYSIEAMRQATSVDKIVVISDEENIKKLCKRYDVVATNGGETRNQSLRNGLEYIKKYYPQCKRVFINEAARPFITAELVDGYFSKLDKYEAVITAQHITDSLGRYAEEVTERAEYYLVQAPEAFHFHLLYDYFSADSPVTATFQQLPAGTHVYRNFDFRQNLKITYPEDLFIAEALMRYYDEISCT